MESPGCITVVHFDLTCIEYDLLKFVNIFASLLKILLYILREINVFSD